MEYERRNGRESEMHLARRETRARARARARAKERFRAHWSYNINDPVCTLAHPVESSIPGQPPSRPIYISVLFKHDCYSISTQLVNALLFNRVARRAAGQGTSCDASHSCSSRTKGVRRGTTRHGNEMSVSDLCNLR